MNDFDFQFYTINFLFLIGVLFLRNAKKLEIDFDTYLSIFNATSCVVVAFWVVVSALNYIPHGFSYYLYCLEHDKKTNNAVIEVFNNYNRIFGWSAFGFFLFLIKRIRRSFKYSIFLAIYSLIGSLAIPFSIYWTGNQDNPLFRLYYQKQMIIFSWDSVFLYLFVGFHIIVYLFYNAYVKNTQNTDYQRDIKILFIICALFLTIIFPIFLR